VRASSVLGGAPRRARLVRARGCNIPCVWPLCREGNAWVGPRLSHLSAMPHLERYSDAVLLRMARA